THGIGRARVQQVIELAGLTSVARRRVGGFSLGMTQRLGIAAALLGDPPTVVLDEPVNGLDPDGVLWIRGLLRSLADDGRTVFLSSHLMSELAAVANRVVVIGRGALLADDDIDALVTRSARRRRPRAVGRAGAAGARARGGGRDGPARRRRPARGHRHRRRHGGCARRRAGRPGARAGHGRRDAGGGVPRPDGGRRRVRRHRRSRGGGRSVVSAALATLPSTPGVTWPRTLASEWGKTWGLRSTRWAVAATVVLNAAMCVLTAFDSLVGPE